MRFGRITPSTRSDLNGVYGYSGHSLDTITSDLPTQWIAPINAAALTPELVVGLALVENDIVLGANIATIQARLTAWLALTKAAWPAAKILLCTPRPFTSYTTPSMVAVYQAARGYMLSLDNGRDIFVARCDGYEDPYNPGRPLALCTIDGDHPSQKGALITGRAIGATVRRIVTPVIPAAIGVNTTLTGSIAASGTGISGTKPTGTSHTGGTDLTCVSTALQPGWRSAFTITGGSVFSMSFVNVGPTISIPGSPPLIAPYAKVRLVSGASNLRFIALDPRIADGGGNTFQYYLQLNSPDLPYSPDFVDGDELTFMVPPKGPNTGSISQLINYLTITVKALNVPVVYDVIEQGYFLA
jgi:hypothetical protein